MRALLFFLLMSLPVFAAYTGELVVQVEKVWQIDSPRTIEDMTLNGTFLALNDFQEVLQMDVSSGAEFEENRGEIRVIYHTDEFTGQATVTATALVRTAYSFSAFSDPPYVPGSLNASGLVEYDDSIYATATSISSGNDKELEVIAALTDWTHEYVTYDLAYWGNPAPATETFLSGGGVCVGYTHLFISLARASGFDTRFVSGYAFADEWQPHAWAEVEIDGTWIPVDATFREFGALDARHIASSYSNDQSEVFDSVVALGNGFKFNSTVTVRTQETKPFPQQIFAHTLLRDDGIFEVTLYNPTSKYVTPTYMLRLPEYIHPEEKEILVIPPGDSITLEYDLQTSELEPGYSHTIPYVIAFQGLLLNDNIIIVKESPGGSAEEEEAPSPCAPSAAALGLSFLVLVAVHITKKA